MAYADEVVTNVLQQQGVSYDDLLARGLDTSVVASELHWSSPARWGDVIAVDGAVERVGRTSFVVVMTISVGERLCAHSRPGAGRRAGALAQGRCSTLSEPVAETSAKPSRSARW